MDLCDVKRHAISDKAWAIIEPLIPKGSGSNDNRLFVDAVLYFAKTGIPWRDLPEYFGNWNSIFTRFNRWSRKGLWKKLFEATADVDPLALAIDSTTIRANQVAAGAKKTNRKTGLGRSRGGLTTKIYLAVNAVGKFCRLIGGPGQESDYKHAPALLAGFTPLYSMAEKGYDSDLIVLLMEGLDWERESVVPPKSNRKEPRDYDVDKYKGRHVVELDELFLGDQSKFEAFREIYKGESCRK